jgi:type I restriction enzyme S subunit
MSISSVAASKGLVGGPFGSSLVGNDYEVVGVPVIRGTNLGFGKYLGGSFVYVSEEKVARDLARNTAVPGDIVFTQRGTLGQVALVDDSAADEYVVSQSQMRLRVDPEVASTEFVYYACAAEAFFRQISDNAISTGVPHINLGILGRLTIPLPGLVTQQSIAEVLGALDGKIATNTVLSNVTDEYLATVLDALLCRGSADVPLATIANTNELTRKPIAGESIRYVDIAAVGVGTHIVPGPIDWDNAPGRARRALRRGDTLWSTVRPNRRSHSLNLSSDRDLIGSTGLAVLTPTTVGFAYLYEITKRAEFTSYLETVAEGSAYPAVRADRFGEAQVPLLPEAQLTAFESLAAPMREHLYSLSQENIQLAATRDALLPQLMSGKLSVKDAEKSLAGVL